jgi:hypothetical protein
VFPPVSDRCQRGSLVIARTFHLVNCTSRLYLSFSDASCMIPVSLSRLETLWSSSAIFWHALPLGRHLGSVTALPPSRLFSLRQSPTFGPCHCPSISSPESHTSKLYFGYMIRQGPEPTSVYESKPCGFQLPDFRLFSLRSSASQSIDLSGQKTRIYNLRWYLG